MTMVQWKYYARVTRVSLYLSTHTMMWPFSMRLKWHHVHHQCLLSVCEQKLILDISTTNKISMVWQNGECSHENCCGSASERFCTNSLLVAAHNNLPNYCAIVALFPKFHLSGKSSHTYSSVIHDFQYWILKLIRNFETSSSCNSKVRF